MSELLHTKQYAMGATAAKGALELIEFIPPELGPKDVFVDVKYCGMCHSDLHKVDDDWEGSKYPMVPGHEVVGVVAAVGAEVTSVSVGQVVGFGPQRGCCEACEYCHDHVENVCTKFDGLYDPKFGGYATSITVDERFTFPIPDGIPLELAGPLLCAGVTTHAPLARYARAGQRVGIIGIGGLGHMALQYARAMGCEVWALSTSPAKEEEARRFGAAHFLVTSDKAAMAAAKDSFDFLLCCASGALNVNDYMKLLKPRRTFCLVGLPSVETPMTFLPFSVVSGEKAIVGSMIGGTDAMKAMLDFSAAHRCYPQIEMLDFSEANIGFQKLRENTPRYRVVLKIDGARERIAAGAGAPPASQ